MESVPATTVLSQFVQLVLPAMDERDPILMGDGDKLLVEVTVHDAGSQWRVEGSVEHYTKSKIPPKAGKKAAT